MKTNTKKLINSFFCILAAFLTIGAFTGCGKSDSKKNEIYEQKAAEARSAIDGHQYSTAVSQLMDGAQNGHVKSQRYLGATLLMLEREEEGVSWIRRAAEAEDSVSQYNLAKCYYYGIGVPKNADEARVWWQKAQNNGLKGGALTLSSDGPTFILE